MFSNHPTLGLAFASLCFSGLIVVGVVFRNANLTIVSVILALAFIVATIKGRGGD